MSNDYETIEIEQEGHIAWLVLNRPKMHNALSPKLLEELGLALNRLRGDEAARVVIIRGAGPSFSSGYDLTPPSTATNDADSVSDWDRLTRNMGLFLQIWDYPKPVLAAVHGYCMAGATQLCVFCDVTIVAENAVIGVPTLPVGAGLIGPLWALLVGPKRAKQLFLACGSRISGKTSAEWGWANFCVPDGEVFAEARHLASRMALMPPAALRIEKSAINVVTELAGLRAVAAQGVSADAVAHEAKFAGEVRSLIREVGLRDAIRRFEGGRWASLSAGTTE